MPGETKRHRGRKAPEPGCQARITTNPRVMGGKPCILGMRVTVDFVAGLQRAGHTRPEILELHTYLEPADIDAVIEFTRARSGEPIRRAESKGGAAEGGPGATVDSVDAGHDPGQPPEPERASDGGLGPFGTDEVYDLGQVLAGMQKDGGILPTSIWQVMKWRAELLAPRDLESTSSSGAEPGRNREPGGARRLSGSRRGKKRGDDVEYEVRRRRYPIEVVGSVDGLPFCLLEVGDIWRFAVSRDPAIDPWTIRTNREGFLVFGRVGDARQRGDAPPLTDAQLLWLIHAALCIMDERVESGRAVDSPALLGARARPERGA